MTITWHDLAAAGAPPVTMVLSTTYGKRAPVKKKRAPKPVAAAPEPLEPAPPRFMFPGAVDILNAAPPSHLVDDDDKENQYGSDDEEDDEAREELVEELSAKFDCDAIRRKIQRFLARKTMTQTAFLRAINVNPNSYRNFMAQKGKHTGVNNGTYDGALVFFHKLEKKEGAAVTSKGAAKPKGAKGPRTEQNAKIQGLFDKINAVTLDEPVYVFDDCDEIRFKINELIESKTVTQAALLRELDVNSNSLRRFLTTKGKRQGCSNGVYLKAYCFFEKLRIAENKPKSNKRIKTESEMPTGYSLERDPIGIWCYKGIPIVDQIRNGTLAPMIDDLRSRLGGQLADGALDEFLFS